MTLLIQAADVGYAHGGKQIFTSVSFEIREGDRLALIGANGAGKSTLFRLLTRELKPQSGAVTHRNNLTIGFVRQEADFAPEQTTRAALARAAGDPAALEAQLRDLEARMAEPLDDEAMAAVLDEYGVTLGRLETAAGYDHEARIARTLSGLGVPEARWDQPIGQLSGG
jgi:ATP-binding cassette subfamily F protein 3